MATAPIAAGSMHQVTGPLEPQRRSSPAARQPEACHEEGRTNPIDRDLEDISVPAIVITRPSSRRRFILLSDSRINSFASDLRMTDF